MGASASSLHGAEPMQFTTDERHQDTLELLAEVRAYMGRWPAHPVHREMLSKIDAHLAEPTQRLLQQVVQERRGDAFTAGGLCLVRAALAGQSLHLSIPGRGWAGAESISQALHHGMTLQMKPITWHASRQAAMQGASTNPEFSI